MPLNLSEALFFKHSYDLFTNIVIKITSALVRELSVFTMYMNLLISTQQVSTRIKKKKKDERDLILY